MEQKNLLDRPLIKDCTGTAMKAFLIFKILLLKLMDFANGKPHFVLIEEAVKMLRCLRLLMERTTVSLE